jgi:hypothetical protein
MKIVVDSIFIIFRVISLSWGWIIVFENPAEEFLLWRAILLFLLYAILTKLQKEMKEYRSIKAKN